MLVSGLYISHWLGCHLDDAFFFSALNLKLRIIFDIRSDQTILSIVARLFHNKIIQGSVDVFNAYIHFWDIRFMLFLFSPLTFFGCILWIFHKIKEGLHLHMLEKVTWLFFLFIPIPILFHVIKNPTIGIVLFSIPVIVFSILGLSQSVQRQKYAWIYVLILFVFSLWCLFFLNTLIVDFCHV